MSNIPIKDAVDATRKVDVFVRTEGADQVEMQAVAIVDPATGNPARPDASGNMPVTGPLTDAQLRASGVPVSGPLTDVQLRAASVPVSGPLTDAQLRAAVVQVAIAELLNTIKATDTPFTGGDFGILTLAKRRDSDTTSVSNDGDYTTLNMDEFGRLKVAAQPAGYASTSGAISAVNGQVALNVARVSNLMIQMTVPSAVSGINVTFEASLNSTNGTDGNWFVIQAVRSNANTIETASGALSAAPGYGWECSVNGMNWFRVRGTAITSGSATFIVQPAPYATEPIPAAQISGTQPVSGTVTATGVVGPAAHDAAISGNPLRLAGRALTANYTAVATGDTADLVTTLVGALIGKPYAIPEADWTYAAAAGGIINTTDVAVKAAAAAGIRNYVTSISLSNNSATATEFVIKDGASTVLWRCHLPANAPNQQVNFPTPLRGSAATAVNVACLTTAAAVFANLQGYIGP